MRRPLRTLLLLLLLGFAVPALLTDLECMVGNPGCDSCSEIAPQECSAASLAAHDTPPPQPPVDSAPERVDPQAAPLAVAVHADRAHRLVPRDGPPGHANGLRAPPA